MVWSRLYYFVLIYFQLYWALQLINIKHDLFKSSVYLIQCFIQGILYIAMTFTMAIDKRAGNLSSVFYLLHNFISLHFWFHNSKESAVESFYSIDNTKSKHIMRHIRHWLSKHEVWKLKTWFEYSIPHMDWNQSIFCKHNATLK